MNLLSIQNLKILIQTKEHNKYITPVDNISIDIKQGETLALLGESGSGKSMLANGIMRLLPPNSYYSKSSKIIFDNIDLLDKSEYQMRKIRGNDISIVFQDSLSALNPVYTIGQQLLEVLYTKNSIEKLSKNKLYEKAIFMLDEVGLLDPEKQFKSYPHQLSGGMRQRVLIAMALAVRPKLLIADEPTTALDVTIQLQILKLIKKLQKKYNIALLFISHDIGVINAIADKIAVMKQGQIVELDYNINIINNPKHEYTKLLLNSLPGYDKREKINNIDILNKPDELIYDLTIENLTIEFPVYKGIIKRIVDKTRVVNNISFKLPAGKTLAIVGESGSGKTTVAKAIMGLYKYSGKIDYFNNLVSIVFQDPYSALNPKMLVIDILQEGYNNFYKKHLTQSKLEDLVESVNLDKSSLYKYPHEFSGGQRQRIAIARALAIKARILILDEPTSALDVSVQANILKLLKKLQFKYNLSYLFITHNISVVAYMADYIAVMQHGNIVEYGSVKDILYNAQDEYTKKLIGSVLDL